MPKRGRRASKDALPGAHRPEVWLSGARLSRGLRPWAVRRPRSACKSATGIVSFSLFSQINAVQHVTLCMLYIRAYIQIRVEALLRPTGSPGALVVACSAHAPPADPRGPGPGFAGFSRPKSIRWIPLRTLDSSRFTGFSSDAAARAEIAPSLWPLSTNLYNMIYYTITILYYTTLHYTIPYYTRL